jgi:hypothetical protein
MQKRPWRPELRSTRSGAGSFVGALLGVSTLLLAASAAADVESCTAAHASGQREAKAGHLKRASELFTTCGSDDSCPEAIRNECMELFSKLDNAIPTLTFSVSDAQGKDVTAVKVYAGEELIRDGLDGRPIPIDPGLYHFRFQLASGEVLNSDVVVREGEKNRVVAVSLKPESVAPVAPEPSASEADAAPVAPEERSKAVPTGAWIAGGIGVAALGSFVTFAVLGRNQHESLADCSPSCDQNREDDYDDLKRNYLIADISLGAAVISFTVAAVLVATSGGAAPDEKRASRTRRRVSVRPELWPTARGGLMGVSGVY